MIRFSWPEPNEVHIHTVNLNDTVYRFVTADEKERGNRLLDPVKKVLFMAGRGVLREILGNYLNLQPEEIQLAFGENGKPYLSQNSRDLQFNLAHSDGLFLLAVTAEHEVGIDVELIRNDTSYHKMARLTFSIEEQKELFNLPEHLQRNAFYRCWTRKEAYLKACGMGFALQSSSFNVSLQQESPVQMIAPGNLSSWFLHDITVSGSFSATVAIQYANPIISYRTGL